jgi:hypothetical protein
VRRAWSSKEFRTNSSIKKIRVIPTSNKLEAYDLEIGLLINFGAKSLEFKRVQNKQFN